MTDTNKERALAFQQMVVAGHIREAYEKYIAPEFRHHNTYFKGDRESLLLAMEENHTRSPGKIFSVKIAIEEDDLVSVYSHVRQNADDIGAAVVHIFRFAGDKIVELWDLGQRIAIDSPNENGPF